MNVYIFDIHINCCFVIDTQVEDGFKYDLLEVGPLNMIGLGILNKVRAAVRSISSSLVPLNWWTEFSTWQDFRALLRTGNRLSMKMGILEFRFLKVMMIYYKPLQSEQRGRK